MRKLAFLLTLTLIFFSSCSDTIQLDVDNPSNMEQRVIIDDEEILLKPHTTTTIKVERGYHSIKMAQDSVMDYKFYENHYLINPLAAEYLIEKVNFSKLSDANRQESDSLFNEQNNHEVVYLGYTIEGNFEVFDNMVIPKNWNYGPRVALPTEIMLEDKGYSHSRTIRKMYAPDEFLELLQEMQPEN